MVVHFGIDPNRGEVAVYNDEKKLSTLLSISKIDENGYNDVDAMYRQIEKIKNDGKLGCAGIYLNPNYNNEIRQKFIEKGKDFGFLKIQIIDFLTLQYLDYITQSKQKSKVGDLIWILHSQNFSIWRKLEAKAELVKVLSTPSFLTEEDFLNANKEASIDKNPTLVIYNQKCKINPFAAKNLIQLKKIYLIEKDKSYAEASLIKARIMAGDEEIQEYNTNAHLDKSIHVEINWKEIDYFYKFQTLPLKASAVFYIEKYMKAIKINFSNCFCYELSVDSKMIENEEILITIQIDKNRIISVTYSLDNYTRKRNWSIEKIESDLQTQHLEKFGKEKIYMIPRKIKSQNFNINVVGINLGASYCYAAVSRKNGIETVALGNTGKRGISSDVLFNKEETICGGGDEMVYRRGVIVKWKEIIGKSFVELKYNKEWLFEIMNVDGKPKIRIQEQDNVIEKYPEEVAAILLKHIKQKCEDFQGTELDETVITVPIWFTERQKLATHVSAILAGWKTVHLLPESVAASLAYFISRPIPNRYTTLIFDLGGHTLDIYLFNVTLGKKRRSAPPYLLYYLFFFQFYC